MMIMGYWTNRHLVFNRRYISGSVLLTVVPLYPTIRHKIQKLLMVHAAVKNNTMSNHFLRSAPRNHLISKIFCCSHFSICCHGFAFKDLCRWFGKDVLPDSILYFIWGGDKSEPPISFIGGSSMKGFD